jgi:hypothetical protein
MLGDVRRLTQEARAAQEQLEGTPLLTVPKKAAGRARRFIARFRSR